MLEVDDRELLDMPAEAVDVVVTSDGIAGRTLADLADEGFARASSCGASAAPVSRCRCSGDRLHRGDVLTIVGPDQTHD